MIEVILRQQALEWWNKMSLEQQFYKLIAANEVIVGDRTRHPNSLTGREIQMVYEFHESKK